MEFVPGKDYIQKTFSRISRVAQYVLAGHLYMHSKWLSESTMKSWKSPKRLFFGVNCTISRMRILLEDVTVTPNIFLSLANDHWPSMDTIYFSNDFYGIMVVHLKYYFIHWKKIVYTRMYFFFQNNKKIESFGLYFV